MSATYVLFDISNLEGTDFLCKLKARPHRISASHNFSFLYVPSFSLVYKEWSSHFCTFLLSLVYDMISFKGLVPDSNLAFFPVAYVELVTRATAMVFDFKKNND